MSISDICTSSFEVFFVAQDLPPTLDVIRSDVAHHPRVTMHVQPLLHLHIQDSPMRVLAKFVHNCSLQHQALIWHERRLGSTFLPAHFFECCFHLR